MEIARFKQVYGLDVFFIPSISIKEFNKSSALASELCAMASTAEKKARKENAALQSTWNVQFCSIKNDDLIAYLKATDDLSNIILVVVTLDPFVSQQGFVQLPKERLKLSDKINVKLTDLITEEKYTWTQEWNYVELNPYKLPFHIFKLEVHESNM
jgi:starch synthase (maltosyl-transferring)